MPRDLPDTIQTTLHLGTADYRPAQVEGALRGAFGVDTQLVADRTYFVAEEGGSMVGCGGWSFRSTLFGSDARGGRDSSLLDPKTQPAKIRAFFVDPAWARRGLGTRLLEACELAAWNAGFRRCEMGATLSGVPLYERHGYQRVADILVDLPGGERLPVVRMEKALASRES